MKNKIKVRWTAEVLMDLQNFEGTDFQQKLNDEIDKEVIESFGSWEEFTLFVNKPFFKTTVVR